MIGPRSEHTVRGTEQSGGYKTFTLLDVIYVIMVSHAHAADMIERMITYVMTAFHNHLEDIGMFADIVTDYKEGGFYTVLVQYVQ
jgi:hypothetical protein